MKKIIIAVAIIILFPVVTMAAVKYMRTMDISTVTVFTNQALTEKNYTLVKITDPTNDTDCYLFNAVAISCYPKQTVPNQTAQSVPVIKGTASFSKIQ
jgi:hypothetical protein